MEVALQDPPVHEFRDAFVGGTEGRVDHGSAGSKKWIREDELTPQKKREGRQRPPVDEREEEEWGWIPTLELEVAAVWS